jgi:hypothetical protein
MHEGPNRWLTSREVRRYGRFRCEVAPCSRQFPNSIARSDSVLKAESDAEKAPLIAAVKSSHAKLNTSLHLSSLELAPAQLRGTIDWHHAASWRSPADAYTPMSHNVADCPRMAIQDLLSLEPANEHAAFAWEGSMRKLAPLLSALLIPYLYVKGQTPISNQGRARRNRGHGVRIHPKQSQTLRRSPIPAMLTRTATAAHRTWATFAASSMPTAGSLATYPAGRVPTRDAKPHSRRQPKPCSKATKKNRALGVLIAETVGTGEATDKLAQAPGTWTECPASAIGVTYALSVQNTTFKLCRSMSRSRCSRYGSVLMLPGNPSGMPVYIVRMEEPGRFHDATLVRNRQPDRTGGAVWICADTATRRTIPRNLFATPEEKQCVHTDHGMFCLVVQDL